MAFYNVAPTLCNSVTFSVQFNSVDLSGETIVRTVSDTLHITVCHETGQLLLCLYPAYSIIIFTIVFALSLLCLCFADRPGSLLPCSGSQMMTLLAGRSG